MISKVLFLFLSTKFGRQLSLDLAESKIINSTTDRWIFKYLYKPHII